MALWSHRSLVGMTIGQAFLSHDHRRKNNLNPTGRLAKQEKEIELQGNPGELWRLQVFKLAGLSILSQV